MPVSVNKLTINTQVNKEGGEGGGQGQRGSKADLSKLEREELIQECLDRVLEYLEYEFNP